MKEQKSRLFFFSKDKKLVKFMKICVCDELSWTTMTLQVSREAKRLLRSIEFSLLNCLVNQAAVEYLLVTGIRFTGSQDIKCFDEFRVMILTIILKFYLCNIMNELLSSPLPDDKTVLWAHTHHLYCVFCLECGIHCTPLHSPPRRFSFDQRKSIEL